MKMKKILSGALVLFALGYAQSASAQQADEVTQQEQLQQDRFSEEELKKFLQANAKVTAIQKEGQQNMLNIIQEAGMDVEQFNKYAQAQREQKLAESGASPEQLAAFDKAAQKIVEIQPTVKENVKKALEEEGLTEDKYREIVTAYQQDEAVKAKVHELMAK
ncbi:DUF4168 domain-containing protein [uncultured Pontibacter sp.]|uniref:DUF4168 domain-containing protein n=1 Tax=uncultured Pontibacter sp. TaxID=453356 RepID=UPI00262DF995|nr:DUF4168 domain-containing protein [uncultured Pontibacter sp.]